MTKQYFIYLAIAALVCLAIGGKCIYDTKHKQSFPTIGKCIGIQFEGDRPCTLRIIPDSNISEPNYPEIIKEKDRLIKQYQGLLQASENQKQDIIREFKKELEKNK